MIDRVCLQHISRYSLVIVCSSLLVFCYSGVDAAGTSNWGFWNWECTSYNPAAKRAPIAYEVAKNNTPFCSDLYPGDNCCVGVLDRSEATFEQIFDSVLAQHGEDIFPEESCKKLMKNMLCSFCAPGSRRFTKLIGTFAQEFQYHIILCYDFCMNISDFCPTLFLKSCGPHKKKECLWEACETFKETVARQFGLYTFYSGMVFGQNSGTNCYGSHGSINLNSGSTLSPSLASLLVGLFILQVFAFLQLPSWQ